MAFRIYVDTSVVGGCADVEYAEESVRFIEMARSGRLVLLISDVVVRELLDALNQFRNCSKVFRRPPSRQFLFPRKCCN